MQKDLSNAADKRRPGRTSLVGSVGVLAVLLATLAVASYPRVAVGAAVGVAATVLVRRWYAQVRTFDTPPSRGGSSVGSGTDNERARTEQREARLANGRG
ncbi:MAG: hypothetical protein V5A13_08270 [Haloarculaceae archaeon]